MAYTPYRWPALPDEYSWLDSEVRGNIWPQLAALDPFGFFGDEFDGGPPQGNRPPWDMGGLRRGADWGGGHAGETWVRGLWKVVTPKVAGTTDIQHMNSDGALVSGGIIHGVAVLPDFGTPSIGDVGLLCNGADRVGVFVTWDASANWLWEVTAVDTGNRQVDLTTWADVSGTLSSVTMSAVAYASFNTPIVGDVGKLARMGDFSPMFFGRRTLADRLWEVTAVNTGSGTLDLTMWDDAVGTLSVAAINGSVFYDASVVPTVGDTGKLAWLYDGTLTFFVGGERSRLIIASAAMIADDTGYVCYYRTAVGTGTTAVTCKRPPGIYISANAYGFLGRDTEGVGMFCPANMREEANMPLVLETRTDDPATPATGRIWLRTDI